MVVAAGAQKGSGVSHPLRNLEAQDLGLEVDGAFQVSHLQVDVAYHGLGWNRGELAIVLQETSVHLVVVSIPRQDKTNRIPPA
jgi:hypothetical protein